MMPMMRYLLFVGLLSLCSLGCSSSDDPTEPANNAPSTPNSPVPTDGASIHTLGMELSWSSTDADGNRLLFDVYLDTTNPPTTRVSRRQEALNYGATSLAPNTTYYWRVDATDGATWSNGPVWSFTTSNNSPAAPSLPGPSHGATHVARDTMLTWTSSDSDGDTLTYDVYLDTKDPPTSLVANGHGSTTLTPATLDGNTTYYWKVVVHDGMQETPGPVWSFKTDVTLPSITFANISVGTFMMGSPASEPHRWSDREAQHEVRLTRDFMMLTTEVTEELWDAVMGGGWSTSQLPQMQVSWGNAIQFCNALSELQGLTPAYQYVGLGHVTWDPDADGYRLPTEAEWEYACRAGTLTAFYSGPILAGGCDEPNFDLVAWYCGDTGGPFYVGQKQPNTWGLFDMYGNLEEWCWDVYQKNYEALPDTDPVGGGYAQNTTERRVKRGGERLSTSQNCRSASRESGQSPGSTHGTNGFRIVRTVN